MTTAPATIVPLYIAEWFGSLEERSLSQVAPDPGTAAVFSADMVVGFCKSGNLASQRIDSLSQPIADLFVKAREYGIEQFVLLQDTHRHNTPEFNSFPPHCLVGTEEAETIPELKELTFSQDFVIFKKNSLHPAVNTGFDGWLDNSPEISTAIVVGNCTDLCVYQLAMHLRMRANARDIGDFQIIVPADLVNTYDLPQEAAKSAGGLAHPGDFFHQVFLYHMALNGIQVVRGIR
jgi:nicotinamidase-related amidase